MVFWCIVDLYICYDTVNSGIVDSVNRLCRAVVSRGQSLSTMRTSMREQDERSKERITQLEKQLRDWYEPNQTIY